MARYIDAELLEPEDFENCTPYQAKEIIDDIPTADVVLKSEVEQLKRNLEQCENGYRQEMHLLQCKLADAKSEAERWRRNLEAVLEELSETKREVAREIFEVIEKDGKYAISFVENHKSYSEEIRQAKLECYKDIQNYIAELKKKYTESEGKE